MLLECILVLIVILIVWDKAFQKGKDQFPPGPPRFPLVGSLFSVLLADAKNPPLAFQKLSKKYGPVVGLQMGSVPVVAFSGHEVLKHIGNSEFLLDRNDGSDFWLLEKSLSLPLGLVFGTKQLWADTRVFMNTQIRKYGFNSKAKSGGLILEEFLEFCDELKHSMVDGELKIKLSDQFAKVFFNVACTFMTGKKFGTGSEVTQKLIHSLDEYVKSSKFTGSMSQIYPKLVPIFPELTGFNNLKKCCAGWWDCLKPIIKEAREGTEYMTNPGSILQEFLQKVDSTPRPDNLLDSIYTEENVTAVFQDMLGAMTETQAKLIKFLIRYLLQNPEIQARLQEEVDQVVGKRLVTIDDIPNLKYMQATLTENYRLGSIAPIVGRKLHEDWKFGKYFIPKGTLIILNVWSGDSDESVWENPNVFNPSRFLSPDGGLVNTEKIFAFGFGKRRCLGEQIGKNSMLLSTTTLIQNFSFHVDPTYGLPSNSGDTLGLVRDLEPFNLIIKSRKE